MAIKEQLKAMHRQTGDWLSKILVHGEVKILGIEDLRLDAKGTKGALAKAILSLPDERELYLTACQQAAYIRNIELYLVLVPPAYTSTAPHFECPALNLPVLVRTRENYDEVECPACHHRVNIHQNAGQIICQRAVHYVFPPAAPP